MTDSSNSEKQVLVCQHRTCTKDGSAEVLAALQASNNSDYTVSGCGCLGLCGSGPMVLVLPDHTYYWHVHPQETKTIVAEHLQEGNPVRAMMHPRLHQNFEQLL